ncbi:inositol monophosphatase [Atractiella rhizophila]|nr:inositol monophosphatase [Atractiella rhizophila]
MDLDLSKIHLFACNLACEVGMYLRTQALARTTLGDGSGGTDLSVEVKENSADLVTRVDKAAEAMIFERIKKAFPDHKLIGEETYSTLDHKRFLLDDSPTWVIDPLDGTVNYLHLFPTWAVSIGFCVNSKPVAGAIIAPALGGYSSSPSNSYGTLYHAAKGLGAWQTPVCFDPSKPHLTPITSENRLHPFEGSVKLPYLSPIPAMPKDAPKGCIFVSEWGKARTDSPESNLTRKVNSFWVMAAEVTGKGGRGGMVHGIRSLGSATMDMVYVATGAADIFWEGGCWEWDVCAGWILIQEAGGLIARANPPEGAEVTESTPVQEGGLGDRLYMAIRPCSATEHETARQSQERVVREVWRRVQKLDYKRPK